MVVTPAPNTNTDIPLPLAQYTQEAMSDQDLRSPIHNIHFLQLNCHLSKEITQTLLHHPVVVDILILQEPWVNPHSLLPPTHHGWHMFASYDHHPRNWQDWHKCCVYVRKSYPSEFLTPLPLNSKHLLGLLVQTLSKHKVTLVNVYNPPRSNDVET